MIRLPAAGPRVRSFASDDPKVPVNPDNRAGSERVIAIVLSPAGSFLMDSPASESGREDNETQQRGNEQSRFWTGKDEVK